MPRAKRRMATSGPSGAALFVAYYRVSTDKQGRSGLGLDAQKATVGQYLASTGGLLIAEFEEVESGKRREHRLQPHAIYPQPGIRKQNTL